MAGFCYGVRRAVEETVKIRQNNPNTNVYILGQLIHNNQVTDYLNSLGIITLDTISVEAEIKKLDLKSFKDSICIIRTHGTGPKTIKTLKKNGCKIVDLTCPDVKRVQNKAVELAKKDYQVIIIGKADHPEVAAIKEHADIFSKNPSIVISSAKEILDLSEEIKKFSKIGVVVQTTQLIENFKEIISSLSETCKELKVYNTICAATFQRQKSARELAKNVNLMIVAGSKSSANTTHLAEVLKPITTTIHIENQDDLSKHKNLLDSVEKIGVTAGASTPDYVIDKILEQLNLY